MNRGGPPSYRRPHGQEVRGRQRLGAALLLGLVLALLGPLGTGGGAPSAVAIDHSRGTPGPCPDDSGVTVIVDFQELGSHGGHEGGVIVRCAQGSGMTGLDALHNAGFEVAGTNRWGQGFICRLEGRPAADEPLPIIGDEGYTEPCVDTPPARGFWSYWHAENGQNWVFSQFGVKNRVAPEGTFEGWSFSLNATEETNPMPRFTPVREAVPEPEPPADGGGGDGGGGDGGGGSGGAGGGGGSEESDPGDGGSGGSGDSGGGAGGSGSGGAGGSGSGSGSGGSGGGEGAGPGGVGSGSDGAGSGDGAGSDGLVDPGATPEEDLNWSGNEDAGPTADAAPPLPRQGGAGDGAVATGDSGQATAGDGIPTPSAAPEEHPEWSGGEDASALAPEEESGPPIGLWVTLGALVLLGVLAFVATRRRRHAE